ncbi:beta strand repeat-containing protein [Kineosporia succinea]|uniref:IPT/TIG domain-containing protein n=1 Tax=Kineosporia succinea TaxID=84632 RepID=A0ABT9P0V9_9ACTN|nr:IPT/TIG domain-containing protein [Kineosporia succinea]MDP9825740.1 hypothetical protein [Kineosporia succinea]
MIVVVLLAWVLVPVVAEKSAAFTGIVAASAYGGRDVTGNTTYGQSAYPATPSGTGAGNTLVSTSTADPLADTAKSTADVQNFSLLGLIGLAAGHAECTATSSGVSGTATAAGLTLLGLPLSNVPANPAPNTTVQQTNILNQNIGYIVYNEQTFSNTATQYYLKVTAAHIVNKDIFGTVTSEYELAHAECGSTKPVTPTISAITPNQGPESGGTSVTVTGTNLFAITSVTFGAFNASSYTMVSNVATSLTVVAPAGTGVQDIRIANGAGTSSISAADKFTYVPVPAITAVSPILGPTSGGTSVVITGTNLSTATTVKFGSVSVNPANFTVNSNTQITALAPAQSAGQVDITVTTVGGTSPAVTADQYTYVAPPTVTAVSPSAGPLTAGASVVLTGTDFTSGSTVKFGATNAVGVTVNSATQITAVAPAGTAGTVNVTVTAIGGTSATATANQYTYTPAPTVTAVAPASGPTSSGTAVVITGTGFTGTGFTSSAVSVGFGANAAVSFTVNSATQITAFAPAGSAGTVDVRVTTPGGISANSAADDYTYTAAPTVTAVSPVRGPLAGGTSVVITGTDFTSGSTVKFGSANATSFTVNSPTQITAVAPASIAGTVDITVTTAGGTSATSSADQFAYTGPPTVTGLSPGNGPIAGGTSVTVTGTNFLGATAVTVGGTAATSFTVSNNTQLVVTTPAHTAGGADIVVTAPGGTSAVTSNDVFTYHDAPTVTAVSPSSGPTTAGTTVVITGTNFAAVSAVRFGANVATGVVTNSSTQITVTAPSGSAGPVDVTVTTPGGTSAITAAGRYTYVAAPTVTSVSPSRGPLAGGNPVVITGTNLSNASAVKFGATVATGVTVNSPTQITATAPAGSAGPVDVTVVTSGGTSATSSADQYTYVAAPTVSNVSPATGPTTGGTSVVITGTGFTGASSVTFGGIPATGVITVSSDTQITAVAPVGSAGTVDVVVTAPGGSSATGAAATFTYVAPPAVIAVSPNSGPVAGSVLGTITITGTGLSGATGVTIDGFPFLTVLSNTATQIVVRGIPPHVTGPAHIQVTNAYGTSVQNSADVYTYQGLPSLTGLSPGSGPVAGGNTVVLTGTGFTTTTGVTFGSNAAVFTVNSDTQITATVPAHAAGSVDVVVQTLYGLTGGSNPLQYTYVPVPVVNVVSPGSGPIAGGTVVTVTGTGFTGATSVSFGGTAATGVSVSSDTRITVFAPAHAAGTVDVTVTSAGGTSVTSVADRFTFVAAPTVTALSPGTGPTTGTTSVVITGTDLLNASTVVFGGNNATSFTVDSNTQITAVTPAHGAGTVDVRVTAVGGTSAISAADQYTYVAAPTVTAVSPNAGPLAGGTTVVVAGTNFTGTTSVSFGGSAASSYTVNSATQITAVAPSGGAGTVDVRVTTAGGTSAVVSGDAYTYQAAPVVTGLSPNHGPVAGGTLVTITGSGFNGATAVTFGGVPATGVISVSTDTQIIAQAPAHAISTVDVVVTAPGGVSPAGGTANDYLYVGAPTVTALSPLNGPAAGGTSVVVTGTGFATATGTSAVQFGGTNAASYTVNSDTQITAVTPAHAAGAAGVVVSTADGGASTVTAANTFTFVAVPTLSGISPGLGPEAGGTSVMISGSGLGTASSVQFGGVPASFTVNSDTQITATTPAGTGLVDVSVTTVGGGAVTAAADRFRYVGTPTVTTISPTSGPVAGGTSITITGTGFYGVTGISFGGGAATSYTVVSPTSITATTPAHAAGPAGVEVTTSYGGTSAAGGPFAYVADPVVTALSPTSGPTVGGTTVIITGSGFSGASAVRFGSTPAASFTVNSGTQISAVSPAGVPGTLDVTVVGLYATSATTSADRFTYVAAPTITAVNPAAGPLSGANPVTVTGTGFTIGTTVSFGGTPATSTTFGSATQLTAVVPPGGAGPVDVVVSTPYGQDTLTNGYRYRAAPSVTGLSPGVGPEAGGTVVTITGTGFSDATAVRFGSTPSTLFTVSSDTSVTATAPAGTGIVDVTVTGPGGTSATGAADRFRYAPVPAVASLSPVFGPTVGGTTVSVAGSGFTGATAVRIDGTTVSFSVVNDSTITFTTPGGSGDVPVTVTTPGGSTLARTFTYANSPTVSALSPDRGPLGGNNTVTITGTGFTSGSSVSFGGTPASVQFVNDTRLDVTVPPGGAGPVSVTVTTPYGTSGAAVYRYVAAPVVNAVQPGAGPLAGGTTVTITGTGFADVAAVTFGTTPATGFTVDSPTQITAVAPGHVADTVDVTVTTPGGTSATSIADRFTYLAAPSVGTVSPASGPVGGGATVTITGTGFSATTSVTFDGQAATVGAITPTQLTVTTPAGSGPGPVLVRVITAGGSDSGLYTYRSAPAVTGLTPGAGPEAGGTVVTIDGSDFTGATQVRFGSAVAVFSVSSDARITATAPAGTGIVDVTVTGPGGTSATNAADRFRYAAVPVVSATVPASGPTAGGTVVTLTGSGFTGASLLTLQGVSVPFVVTGDSTITFTAPAGVAGPQNLLVTTPGGSSTPVPFLYADAPSLSQLTPDAGPPGGGTVVTLSGSDFTPGSSVTFGGTPVSVTYVSASQLTVVSPARASTGAVNVVVTTAYGTSSAGPSFTYTNAPTISTVSPGAGPLSGGTTVTIAGSGLTGASAVTFDGVAAASFTVNGDASITAVSPAGSAGNAVVRVTTVGGSDTGTFRYAAAPTISAVTPAAGSQAGGTLVTITGSGFTGATSLTFGPNPATGLTVSSDTEMSAFAPAGTGTVNVVVTTPGGTSSPAPYRYAPVPAVTQLSPASGPVTGATPITVTGSGFTGSSAVTVDGSSVAHTVVNDSTITLTAPAHAAGAVPLVVTTPGGSSVPVAYTYVSAPAVTSLTPPAGPLGGGTAVTIRGTDFTLASTVTFGGMAAGLTFVSSTELTAVSPPRASAGAVNVVVTTGYGTSGVGNSFTYTNAPTISAVSPGSGPLSGGTTVTIAGSGFSAASGVTVDGAPAGFTVVDDSTVTVIMPAHAAGSAPVVVTTAGGSSAPVPFVYVNPPVITSITPRAGPEAGGTSVIIAGTGLSAATEVRFGTVAAGFTVDGPTQITAVSPAGTGIADVTVTTAGGTSTTGAADRFRYAPVPALGSAGPNVGPIGGGTVVTVSGTGFTGAILLTVDGASVPFTVADDSTITFTTPPGSAGAKNIEVTTPGGVSGTTSFTYFDASVVTGLAPDEGPVAGGTVVTLTGLGFTGTTGVTFGGVPATSFAVNGPTQITAVSPPGTGSADVVVSGPGGSSPPGATFTYRPVPGIGSLSPTSGPVTGGTVITVSGSGFSGAGSVTVGGVAVPFTVVDDQTVTFTTPPGSAGAEAVIVSTAGGSATVTFTYANAPAVTALSPSAGPRGGGTGVTITGTGFTLASTVAFGAQPAASVQFVSSTELVAVSPFSATVTTVDVVVTTAYGSSGAGNGFTYSESPVVTDVQPRSGPINGGNTVTITGLDFQGITGVSFGAVSAAAFTRVSATEITATVPGQAAGPVDVRVTGSGGTSPISAGDRYSYLTAPSVTSLAPNAGPVAGGTSVTITGSGFVTGSTVTFDGANASSVQWVSASQLIATTPSHTAGTVDVVVTTPGGPSAVGVTFEYQNAPAVSGLVPASGAAGGGTPVRISGSGFTSLSTVRFGSVPAASVQFVSAGRLDVVSPAGAVGPVDVVVRTGGGESAPEVFTYVARPVVTVVQPGSGPEAGGSAVVVTGTGFTGASDVYFGSVPATSFSVDSDTRITAVSPAGSGTVDVTVRTAGVTSATSVADGFTYYPPPQIVTVLPPSGPAAGGTEVTLSGSGFTGATGVLVGPDPATFRVVDDSTIVLTVPVGPVGNRVITIVTPGGTATGGFGYLNLPGVTGVSPVRGPLVGGSTVTITGSGFLGASAVAFGSLPAVSYSVVDDTTITAQVPAATQPGGVDVRVTVSGATSPVVAAGRYTYVAAPVLNGVSPASGPVAGGTSVVLRGNGFTGVTRVLFGGVPATAVSVQDNGSTVTAVTPLHAMGSVAVVVTTDGGDSAPGVFTYVPTPLVAAVAPDSGPTDGGTAVTVTGSGLENGTVTLDGVAVTPESVTDASIVLRTPAHAAGPVTIGVSTAGGRADSTFTYVEPPSGPVLTGVDPASGPVAGGNSVTLTGLGFGGATQVRFGPEDAGFTVVDDTTITATVPPGSVGAAALSVTTPLGVTSGDVTYAYLAPPEAPTISDVTPAIGPTAGGTRITLTGTGFDADTAVSFDGIPGTEVQAGVSVQSVVAPVPAGIRATASTSLTVVSPPHTEGPAEILVSNSAGSAAANVDFVYVPPLVEATISLEVQTNEATAVAPQGSLYAGLEVQSCSTPNRGAASVGRNAVFCRYTAPDSVGVDAFTMAVTDDLGQMARQAVRITVTDPDPGGEGTGGEGGNDNGGDDGGTGTGGEGGNDNNGGSGGEGGNGNGVDGGPGAGGGATPPPDGTSTSSPVPSVAATPGPGTVVADPPGVGGPVATATPAPEPSSFSINRLPWWVFPLIALLLVLLVSALGRFWWFLAGRRRRRRDGES